MGTKGVSSNNLREKIMPELPEVETIKNELFQLCFVSTLNMTETYLQSYAIVLMIACLFSYETQ